MKKPSIFLMMCTRAPGGMRSVVEQYRSDGLLDKFSVQLIDTHALGSRFFRAYMALSAGFNLLWALMAYDVRLAHIHAAMRGSFWRKGAYLLLAKALSVPTLMHLHGSESKQFFGAMRGFPRKLAIHILTSADRVIVLSESWKSFIHNFAPRANICVLPNYVTMPVLPGPAEIEAGNKGQPDRSLEVLFLGKVGQRKGIYDLLPAFSNARKAFPQLKLIIGGDGDIDEAKRHAATLGMEDDVSFIGWVDGDLKADLLSRCSLYVLPSYNEGLPVSVLEAMSYGKPVITTTVGGIPELIDNGINGVMISPGDQQALTREIVRLASDKELRMRLGQQARYRVQAGFSDAVILPILEDVYVSVAKSREARS